MSTEKDAIRFFRLSDLADCANIYAAVLSVGQKLGRKHTKLNLGYIRDEVSNGALSFIGESTNLPDLGGKMKEMWLLFSISAGPVGSQFPSRRERGRESYKALKIDIDAAP